jgi:hypothetical protein
VQEASESIPSTLTKGSQRSVQIADGLRTEPGTLVSVEFVEDFVDCMILLLDHETIAKFQEIPVKDFSTQIEETFEFQLSLNFIGHGMLAFCQKKTFQETPLIGSLQCPLYFLSFLESDFERLSWSDPRLGDVSARFSSFGTVLRLSMLCSPYFAFLSMRIDILGCPLP